MRRSIHALGRRASAFGFPLLLAAIPALGLAQGACSSEVLSVRATPVTVGYCVSGPIAHSAGGEIAVPVRATYASARGSFAQIATLRFIAGEGPALVLQSVQLARLGITGTLHLTLRYDGAAVRIQGAMLTPGALTIK